jgi:hypothetical protein
MRSQLDCHDTRLPGTGVFDIKTRGCLPCRIDLLNFEVFAPSFLELCRVDDVENSKTWGIRSDIRLDGSKVSTESMLILSNRLS